VIAFASPAEVRSRTTVLLVMALTINVWLCRAQKAPGQSVAPQAHASHSSSDRMAAVQLHQAIVVAQNGDAERALMLTQQLLAKLPAYEPALKFQGALLADAGHAAESESSFEHALRLAPNDPELLFTVGVYQLGAGDYAHAAELLAHGAKLSPQDSQMFYYLAQAEHFLGKDDLALEDSRKSVEIEPRNAAMLQKYGELLTVSGNNLEAANWLAKAQQLDPALADIDFDLGIANLRNEDLDRAATFAKAAVEKQPNDPRALKLKAEIDAKLGDWPQAQELFKHLLEIDSTDATSLLELGHSELELKQYQASIDTLQQVLREAPTTILAHFYLARDYAGLGDAADAAHETEMHNQLVQLAGSVVPQDEKQVEQATYLQARQMLSEGHEAEALQLFRDRAKGPTKTPGSAYMLVGVSYLYMDRSADAERCLNKALAIEPAVRDAHTYLGLIAMQHDDLAGAEREFNTELKADPNSQLAVAEIGEVRYRQGRWAEAAEQITRSRTVSPALLYMLSDADFHLGKLQEADLAAELAHDYGKDDPANQARIVDLLQRNHQSALAARLSAH
jgi:predicted Zn-dependent protease